MNSASPLRYPGGKAAIAELLANIRKLNGLGGMPIAEPFAGGAGASLKLLYLEETQSIYINDADPAIHDFWQCLVRQVEPFLETLRHSRASMAEWRRQKAIYASGRKASRLRHGFAAFYLNRCNHSGIIMNGGPIGGVRQTGKWKIGARYNKESLTERCSKVAEYRDRIEVSCEDGLNFIQTLDPSDSFFFIDPPYYVKGPELYLNGLDAAYHARLAECLHEMQEEAWVLTYDDCPEIRAMYRGWARIRPFSIRYSASQRRPGKEVLITPPWMILPRAQTSAAVTW